MPAHKFKFDYKKEFKDLYMPKQKPMLIDVDVMDFIMVDGVGAPGGESYKNAMSVLYALTFTIKMSKMSGKQPEGYFEYVVPPLEGLWWGDKELFENNERDKWNWTSMIRQPEFVTKDVYNWAVEEYKRKNPIDPSLERSRKGKPGDQVADVSKARFETFKEGFCVQIMHIGPYNEEKFSLEKIDKFIEDNDLINDTGLVRKHHEIYLGDPRKTAPERLRTVLRIPVRKKETKG